LIFNKEARVCLSSMKRCDVNVPELDASVPTTYWRSDVPPREGQTPPRVLLLHGADASALEWRYLVPKLNALGLSTVAVDWLSGGWTDRSAFCDLLAGSKTEANEPWALMRHHLRAFVEQEFNGEPVLLVGASLGGAVALDMAHSHQEAVAGLVLCDAGGESYASPPAPIVSALASVVLGVKKALAFVTSHAASEDLRINSLHRAEPRWADALGCYFRSGGYERRVNRPLIRAVQSPTLVVWGSNDNILPVSDAYAFERDLPHCAGVHEVTGCGHCPQLEDPEAVAHLIAQFAAELASAEK